jgi:REP element-mobilizing transposase RayT
VGWAKAPTGPRKTRPDDKLRAVPTKPLREALMSRYRRLKIEGGAFFYTLALADRGSDLLIRHIERLRRAYAEVEKRHPFETVAICILPDHIHAQWQLPDRDADYAARWSLCPRLMCALICEDLRRRVRHLKVSFHHSHDANGERAPNNKECQVPTHGCSLP